MELPYTVDVLEQCQISPPFGSVPKTSLPLTFFDIIWLPLSLSPVQRLFMYEFNHPKSYFMDTILPNMKHSLSLTLQHFFPFAGNLTWPQDSTKPEILYNDGDSVSFTVAESDYDFHQLAGNHVKDANQLHPLVPDLLNMSNSKLASVLALQVTLSPHKGMCIGVTYNHTSADGGTVSQFIKSWASVCRLQGDTALIIESPPCYDRTIVKDPKGLEMILLDVTNNRYNINKETFNTPVPENSPDNLADKVRATFVLGQSDIKRLKQWILTRLSTPPLHLSTFVVTYSYVWVCLVKARWGQDVVANAYGDQKENILFPIDCRPKLDPPLPKTYFGNCLTAGIASAKRGDLIGLDGIAIAAELLGKAIKNVDSADKLMNNLETIILENKLQAMEGCLVSVAGSTKLGVYETDFGWGTPKKVEVVSIADTGAISLSECPNEIGAVEVGVVRNKIEMDAFSSLFVKTIQGFPQCNIDG
ncbi:hypothetical protein IFM89_036761 [Coptis chinensis]|uniref:Uncharacterized protein n=1 Tax=Coptis chinensis TaxID=261450 RepID=A0A835LPQ3_9MAGN|nr:hypothetical protein IFM89_036761 [Coptis chinensis]